MIISIFIRMKKETEAGPDQTAVLELFFLEGEEAPAETDFELTAIVLVELGAGE